MIDTDVMGQDAATKLLKTSIHDGGISSKSVLNYTIIVSITVRDKFKLSCTG